VKDAIAAAATASATLTDVSSSGGKSESSCTKIQTSHHNTTEGKKEDDSNSADTRKNSNTTCNLSPIPVISLEPTTILEVADTFVTVAEACGVGHRGVQMKTDFINNLQLLYSTVASHCEKRQQQCDSNDGTIRHQKPRLLLLEWIDPVRKRKIAIITFFPSSNDKD